MGKELKDKNFHIMATDALGYYRGNEIVAKILIDLGILKEEDIPEEYSEQDELFNSHGFFVGKYTYEVDMMEDTNDNGREIFKTVFAELAEGGKKMKENFDSVLDNEQYWEALKKIEDYISKGRFAQRLSNELINDLIPNYIRKGLTTIVDKVKGNYE